MAENTLPPAETTNQSTDHEHVYELKGGPTWWAECDVMIDQGERDESPGDGRSMTPCGHKFNRGNGVVCGSRDKVKAALRARG